MTDRDARLYFERLYSMSFAAAYDTVRQEIPTLGRDELLPLLLRAPYIPEHLKVGSVAEKNHATLAEALLGLALSLMGLDTFVLHRRGDVPDVLARSQRHGYRLVADAKCARLSRQTIADKDLKIGTVDDWRVYFKFTAIEKRSSGLHFAKIECLPDGSWQMIADDVKQGELANLASLGGIDDEDKPKGVEERRSNAALIVLPYRQLPRVAGRLLEQCQVWDVTLLPWEHLYALTALGVTEAARHSLDDAWHTSFAMRRGPLKHCNPDWRLRRMPEEDRLLAEAIGLPTGKLRDAISPAIEAMARRADEELATIPTEEERIEKLRSLMSAPKLTKNTKADIRQLINSSKLPEQILKSKDFALEWLGKRER